MQIHVLCGCCPCAVLTGLLPTCLQNQVYFTQRWCSVCLVLTTVLLLQPLSSSHLTPQFKVNVFVSLHLQLCNQYPKYLIQNSRLNLAQDAEIENCENMGANLHINVQEMYMSFFFLNGEESRRPSKSCFQICYLFLDGCTLFSPLDAAKLLSCCTHYNVNIY